MKHLLTFILACILTVGAASAQSNNDNALIGRARGELGDCFGRAHAQYAPPYNTDVYTVSSCFAGGFITRVSFSKVIFGPPCNPNINPDCNPPLPILQLIGTVDFGCEGEIIGSECFLEF